MTKAQTKTGATAVDLRKAVRIVSKNLVKIRVTGSSEPERLSNIFDLSDGGLRVLLHAKPPAVGTLYHVTLNLAEQEQVLTVKAALRWSSPWKERRGSHFVGLQFLNLTRTEVDALKQYIQSASQSQKRSV